MTTVTAELVDAKAEAVKAELRLDMAEAVSGLTAALKELGAEVRIAIEKQNATIEKQNAAIEKQGAEFTAALKELGAEVRIAIEKQNATIEKQNAAIEKQNAAIEKQNAAIEKHGAEHTAALAKHSSALDQRLTTRTYWMFGAVAAGYLTLFGAVWPPSAAWCPLEPVEAQDSRPLPAAAGSSLATTGRVEADDQGVRPGGAAKRSIRAASSVSLRVRPPSSRVVRVSFTRRCLMSMSGWWNARSASTAAAAVNPTASAKPRKENVLVMDPPRRSQPGWALRNSERSPPSKSAMPQP